MKKVFMWCLVGLFFTGERRIVASPDVRHLSRRLLNAGGIAKSCTLTPFPPAMRIMLGSFASEASVALKRASPESFPGTGYRKLNEGRPYYRNSDYEQSH
jgi:hypothetical protein